MCGNFYTQDCCEDISKNVSSYLNTIVILLTESTNGLFFSYERWPKDVEG